MSLVEELDSKINTNEKRLEIIEGRLNENTIWNTQNNKEIYDRIDYVEH